MQSFIKRNGSREVPGKALFQVSGARTTVQVSPFQGLPFSPAFVSHLKIQSIIILGGWTHLYPSAHARAFPKFSLIFFFFSLLGHQRIIYSFLQALIFLFYLVVLLFNSPVANNTQKDREYSTLGQSFFAPCLKKKKSPPLFFPFLCLV